MFVVVYNIYEKFDFGNSGKGGGKMSYFPLFIELKNKRCLVVGGGGIALHKAGVLKGFGAGVVVVASSILPELRGMEGIVCLERGFLPGDLDGRALVVAATDDSSLNHRISLLCQKRGIPVNAVDQPEDCSFIFPAYIKEGEVVAAFVSGGQSPVVTQYLKECMRPVLTELIGDLAEQLGSLREAVKQSVPGEGRKAVYQELLNWGLGKGRTLTEKEIRRIVGGAVEWKD